MIAFGFLFFSGFFVIPFGIYGIKHVVLVFFSKDSKYGSMVSTIPLPLLFGRKGFKNNKRPKGSMKIGRRKSCIFCLTNQS